jgi:hypothetical protein
MDVGIIELHFPRLLTMIPDPKKQNGTQPDFDNGLRLMEELLSQMERSQRLMWQSAEAVGDLYRIYLLGGDGCIEAAEFYPAKDETEALEIAASLHATCSDVFSGYEIWRGPRRIAPAQKKQAIHDENDFSVGALLKHQDVILDLEDRLQNAFSCVSRSRKLVELARQLRARLRGSFDDPAVLQNC